jgi:hypothetical protein
MKVPTPEFINPFRPGAGHMPPYLAGRKEETQQFQTLLSQEVVLQNMVLTGLRGVGKTVLLETLKPMAIERGWLWVGTDLSESTSISEENLVTRLFTDLVVVTSSLSIGSQEIREIGFGDKSRRRERTLDFEALREIYASTPGLVADKLKRTLQIVWSVLSAHGRHGLIFAYDEAQNLADHADKDQFPLSLLLDVFQSLQRKNIRFMLVLTGLPTLFPKLVEARTYAERMFRVVFLKRLNPADSRDAVLKPIHVGRCPVKLDENSVKQTVEMSGGYPYFIQFICREVYDVFIHKMASKETPSVPAADILRKLDADFFAGRWARATDRQRDLLSVIAKLPHCDEEFTVQEIVDLSKRELKHPFSNSHVNQMLATLSENGLVYKNRHGKYSFAVPLLGHFILRQIQQR